MLKVAQPFPPQVSKESHDASMLCMKRIAELLGLKKLPE